MAKIVNSCKRAFDILELFIDSREPLTLRQISHRIEAPLSTCVDIVHTLCAKDYLASIGDKREYYPTSKLFYIGKQLSFGSEIIRLEKSLEMLHERTGETCLITTQKGECLQVVEVIEAIHPLRYSIAVGASVHFHLTAAGKAMLGLMDEKSLNDFVGKLKLKKATGKTITSKTALVDSITRYRTRGWYESDEEAYTDILSIAVAFYLGEKIYAISVVGPKIRILSKRELIVQQLTAIKKQFSGSKQAADTQE